MSKKIAGLLLLSTALLSLSGCGNTAKKAGETATETKETQTSSDLNISNVDLNDKDLEEKWKKEPRYGSKVQITFNGGLCTSALGIAHAKGFLAKYGLESEVHNVPQAVDALGTGKVDAMSDHISTSVVPAINGVNMVFSRAANTGCKTLFVLTESPIKSTKELEGKTVAIHDGIGASDHNIILRFFAKDNVDYSKVDFKNVETAATIQAMKNGEVHASIFGDQFAQKFIDQGIIRPIRSITYDDDFKIEPCCVLILNKDFVEKNPITAAKLTLAHKEASAWLEKNKKEAAEVIKANNWGSGNVENDLKFLELYNFDVSDEQTEKSLTDVINDYKNFKLIGTDLDTKETLNKIWRPAKSN